MKHYPHHIGDFDKATRHLNRIERSVYRDLLDLYYDTEARIPLDLKWVCRRILATSNEESTVVEQVLNEFFTETPTGWWHARCDEVIAEYHANTSQRSEAGKKSAAAKKAKKAAILNEMATLVQRSLNSVDGLVDESSNGSSTTPQLTNEPETNEPINQGESAAAPPPAKPSRAKPVEKPTEVEQQVWADWLALRKAKKAPVTETVVEGAANEATKAGLSLNDFLSIWCLRGSQGLQADWIKPEEKQRYAGNPLATYAERDRLAGIKRWEEMTGRIHPENPEYAGRIDQLPGIEPITTLELPQ